MRVGVGIGGLQACNIRRRGFNGNVSGFHHFQQFGAGTLVHLHDAGAEALLRLRSEGRAAIKAEGLVTQAGTDAFAAVVADAVFSVELVTSHVVDLKVQR